MNTKVPLLSATLTSSIKKTSTEGEHENLHIAAEKILLSFPIQAQNVTIDIMRFSPTSSA
jgi:hypothetical protein